MNIDRTRLLGDTPMVPRVCEGPGAPGLVSVLIPTYNRAHVLGAAIESALAQTYRPIEIIVVDDGSHDGTRLLVESFNAGIRYIYQENQGLAAARNTGLAAAEGEFIALLDSDDEWRPWKLQVQVALMRRVPELALVWTDMTTVDSDGTVVGEAQLETMYCVYGKISKEEYLPQTGRVRDLCSDCPPSVMDASFRYGDIFAPMFLGNLIHPPSVLLRRVAVCRSGGLDLRFSLTCEDYEFLWRVSREGLGALVEASSTLYRVRGNDQLTSPQMHLSIAHGNLMALKRRLEEQGDGCSLPPSLIRSHLAEAYAWVAGEELRSGIGHESVKYAWKSLSLDPFRISVLVLVLLSAVPRPVLACAISFRRPLKVLVLRLGDFWQDIVEQVWWG